MTAARDAGGAATEAMVEAGCRAAVRASRPSADPDKLTPMPRGLAGEMPLWRTYERLVRAALDAALVLRRAQPEADALREDVGKLASALDATTRRAARLQSFVGFVRAWVHRQTPPNAVNPITDETKLDAIRHHPMLNDTDTCLAGLAQEATERRLAASDRALAEARGVLRRVEWAPNYGLDANCPICLAWERNGHKPGCALAAQLATDPGPGTAGASTGGDGHG